MGFILESYLLWGLFLSGVFFSPFQKPIISFKVLWPGMFLALLVGVLTLIVLASVCVLVNSLLALGLVVVGFDTGQGFVVVLGFVVVWLSNTILGLGGGSVGFVVGLRFVVVGFSNKSLGLVGGSSWA